MKKYVILLIILLFLPAIAFAGKTENWQKIEKTLGRNGKSQEGVFKVTFPRDDLHVKIGGISVDSDLALTSWAAFKKINNKFLVMGDLVLLESEVPTVMKKLLSNGIEITALHNHLVGESPRVMFMHFEGKGKREQLANTIRSAVAMTGTPTSTPTVKTQYVKEYKWDEIKSILGAGKSSGNILKYSFPRTETIKLSGEELPTVMGTASSIAFQHIAKEKAVTYGDFVLLDKEVNPVAKILTQNGINVTAVHNHMLFESPRLFYMHFWGEGEPGKLALGIKKALGKTGTNTKKIK